METGGLGAKGDESPPENGTERSYDESMTHR